MSFPALFLVIVLAYLAASVMTTDLTSAHTAARAAAAHAADTAISTAQADFLVEVANIVKNDAAAGTDPAGDILYRLPSLGTNAPAGAAGFQTTFSAHVATSTATDAGGAGTNDVAQNVETSPIVQEQRFSAILSARITNGGPTVATRARLVTFRTFRAAPWVLVDGIRELGADDTQSAAQGDLGGTVAQANDASVPDPSDPSRYHDTRIKATGSCSSSGAGDGTDGLPWNGGGSAVSETCDTPQGSLTNPATPIPWRNGSASQGGWSQ